MLFLENLLGLGSVIFKIRFSHVGVHNTIPEYVSTASILKPCEKKFLKKSFSPQISSRAPSPQETEHGKKKKKKAPRVFSIKRRSQYFERRKTLQLQKHFLM
jgi:hypothetical protein